MLADTSGALNYIIRTLGMSAEGVRWLANARAARRSVVIAMTWQGLPFFAMVFIAGLTSIPADLCEAATVDGAGRLQKFCT